MTNALVFFCSLSHCCHSCHSFACSSVVSIPVGFLLAKVILLPYLAGNKDRISLLIWRVRESFTSSFWPQVSLLPICLEGIYTNIYIYIYTPSPSVSLSGRIQGLVWSPGSMHDFCFCGSSPGGGHGARATQSPAPSPSRFLILYHDRV